MTTTAIQEALEAAHDSNDPNERYEWGKAERKRPGMGLTVFKRRVIEFLSNVPEHMSVLELRDELTDNEDDPVEE